MKNIRDKRNTILPNRWPIKTLLVVFLSIAFLAIPEQASAFRFWFLKSIPAGPLPLMETDDPSFGGGRNVYNTIITSLRSNDLQLCLNNGNSIALANKDVPLSPYCWESVQRDSGVNARRSPIIVDGAAVHTAIACWNRNSSVTRKGQSLICLGTPQELTRTVLLPNGRAPELKPSQERKKIVTELKQR